MVIVLVLSVIAVAVVRLGASETAGATAGARRAALSQCAETAARLLTSKFKLQGVAITDITPIDAPLGGPLGLTWARGGHFDGYTEAGWGVSISQVSLMNPASLGPPALSDSTNTIRRDGALGGGANKVMVHCQEGAQGSANGSPPPAAAGRQLEIEFGIRFGI
jgi:hypothetical protein